MQTIIQRLKLLENYGKRVLAVGAMTAMCTVATRATSETVNIGATQRWRNVVESPSLYDDEMRRIDSMINVDNATKSTHRIPALISRFDAVVHYRAEENLSLLVNAIGSGTYRDYPAVDVLARNWHIDAERRLWFSVKPWVTWTHF